MRYFDKTHNRLIWLNEKASADYWSKQWDDQGIDRSIYKPTSEIARLTAGYFKPADGPILEAGCGRANHVYALMKQGYDVTGIDFAESTVQKAKEIVPELNIRAGDVLDLPYETGSFSGYWSVGLIEHFWDGFDPLAKEASRVLKSGGTAFITCPYMSPFRRLKASLNRYPLWPAENKSEPENFYQFGLDQTVVKETFEKYGFKCIAKKPLNGIKGFKSEVAWAAPALQKLYDYKGRSYLIRGGRYALTQALAYVAGHGILLVFEKK